MKKTFLPIVILLVFSTVLVVDFVSPVAAESMIYIRSDGSVEPSTASIQRVGNVYTFTDDIKGSIIVERDNCVIDGAGFTLQGTGADDYRSAIPEINITDWLQNMTAIPKYDETIIPESNNTGIYSYAQKLTIMNLKLTEFWCAIELEYSSDNCIIDNEITTNTQGVWIHSSSNNTISGNNITNTKRGITLTAAHNNIYANNITGNSEYGIKLFWSFNNIAENRITNSGCGVSFEDSSHNVFRNNSFTENSHVFYMSGSPFQEYIQDVDSSNLANGKPICYWINKQDLTVPNDAGWVALVNCTRIRVENLNLAVGQEIWLILTTNSTVAKNVMAHNQVCICLSEASNNTVEWNTIADIYCGIQLEGSSNNYIRYNNVTGSAKGIELTSSTTNVIQQNSITRNDHGIKLTESTGNIISGNSLTANVQGIYFEHRGIIMDADDPYNSTIIYACSNNIFSKNKISENNCGVRMSSTSNNTFSGNNFINNTEQIKMEDSTRFLDANDIEPSSSRFASVNFWDNGEKGNYWSNYTGTDSDGDGIGDTPYVIDKNNQDNYPLMSANVIPDAPDDEKPVTQDITLVAIAAVIGLAIVVGIAFYRRNRKT
jgi:parallel beta-helix repeat protein